MALPYLQPGSASWPPISDAPERVGQSDDVLAKDRSVKEVLDHLIYSTAKAVIEPVRDLGAGETPKPFTPDNSGGCATQPIQELRQQMGRLLEQTVALVGSLREGETARATWQHPSLGPLNLKELIALHRLHIMDHVQQIEKIKADPGYPRDERR